MDKIGKRVKLIRTKNHETLRETAEAIGVDYTHLSKIENSKNIPSVELLKKLADHFEVPIGYFFGEVKDLEELKTETDMEFIKDVDVLSVVDLMNKYNIKLEGEKLTEREIRSFIAWIKSLRDEN